MNILIVTQYFWPENFRINDLTQGLKDKGHNIVVLTGKPNYPKGKFFDGYGFFKKSRENWDGIDIVRSPLIPRGKGGGKRLFFNYISFSLFASFRSLFLKFKPDLIFVYEPSPITVGIPAIFVKRKTKAKLVLWVQDLWPQVLEVSGGIKNKSVINAAGKLTRWIYAKCDKIWVQSDAFTGYLEQQNVPTQKIAYYPNSSENFYKPQPKDEKYRKYFTSKNNIVFAGNIGESQAFDSIINAAAIVKKENPSIIWTIIGDGRLKSYVEAKVTELGLEENFKLIGSFPPQQMPKFFAYADALLVSLKKDPVISLTIPSKLQSYMACGRPILGMLDGKGKSIINEANCGYTAPGEDEVALSEIVINFFKLSSQERSTMGQNAVSYYKQHFDRDMLVDRFLTLANE